MDPISLRRPRRPVFALSHVTRTRAARSGGAIECRDLRSSISDDQRTGRPCDQGQGLRRISQASRRELRRTGAERAPGSYYARAGYRGAAPWRPHRTSPRRPDAASGGPGSRRVPNSPFRRVQPGVSLVARRSADDYDDSPSAFFPGDERAGQTYPHFSCRPQHGTRETGARLEESGASAHGQTARRALFLGCRSQKNPGELCRAAEHAEVAVRFSKDALATEMVREMTELQGTMGGIYARDDRHPEEVWKAISYHYLPVAGEADAPPSANQLGAATTTWAAVSMADKLDTVVGMFAVGERPTGSRDPFGVRRA